MLPLRINNRICQNQWELRKNKIMTNKIISARPQTNSSCPKFYKPSPLFLPKRERSYNNYFKFSKLTNGSPSKQFKINYQRKNEHMRIAQENQNFVKRLAEGKTSYNIRQLVRDYNQSQYYKKQVCNFPSIDFYRTRKDFAKMTKSNDEYISFINANRLGKLRSVNDRYSAYFNDKKVNINRHEEGNTYMNSKNSNAENKKDKLRRTRSHESNVMNSDRVNIQNLGVCVVEVVSDDIKSMIKIEPEDDGKNYIYAILFNNPKTIKNEFKSNEELIQCLEYNSDVNIVKFNKVKKDVDSKCEKKKHKELQEKQEKEKEYQQYMEKQENNKQLDNEQNKQQNNEQKDVEYNKQNENEQNKQKDKPNNEQLDKVQHDEEHKHKDKDKDKEQNKQNDNEENKPKECKEKQDQYEYQEQDEQIKYQKDNEQQQPIKQENNNEKQEPIKNQEQIYQEQEEQIKQEEKK